jgi:hypothetical protein
VATLQQLQQQSPHQEQQQQQSTCGQQVALCAVRDWRFNKAAEDVEWLLTWSSGDGTLVTSSWQVLYSISHAATWAQLQRFLLPRLTRVRGWCQGGAASGPGSLAEGLYRPTPHAFQPWSRDAVLDWRYSRTRGQVGHPGCQEVAQQQQQQHGQPCGTCGIACMSPSGVPLPKQLSPGLGLL